MANKFVAKKQSLSMKKSIKSWNRGTKMKIIAKPDNIMTRSSRNGLILT